MGMRQGGRGAGRRPARRKPRLPSLRPRGCGFHGGACSGEEEKAQSRSRGLRAAVGRASRTESCVPQTRCSTPEEALAGPCRCPGPSTGGQSASRSGGSRGHVRERGAGWTDGLGTGARPGPPLSTPDPSVSEVEAPGAGPCVIPDARHLTSVLRVPLAELWTHSCRGVAIPHGLGADGTGSALRRLGIPLPGQASFHARQLPAPGSLRTPFLTAHDLPLTPQPLHPCLARSPMSMLAVLFPEPGPPQCPRAGVQSPPASTEPCVGHEALAFSAFAPHLPSETASSLACGFLAASAEPSLRVGGSGMGYWPHEVTEPPPSHTPSLCI